MDGLMMDYPLVLPQILERARRMFPDKEVVSQIGETRHRTTYRELHGRVLRLMNVLRDLGVKPGDRVATFAWNHYRHLELYFAIPAVGAVMHTVNIRLSEQQLEYIINHAEDAVIFVDGSLLELLEPLQDKLPTLRHTVVMDDTGTGISQTGLPNPADYEALMAAAGTEAAMAPMGENDACALCYTSGTTGNPKGVLYDHRSLYLVALQAAMRDVLSLSEGDVILPVVPMFHANAWCVPYAAPLVGAALVFTGRDMTPENIYALLDSERVTMAMGVPTIWIGLQQYLRATGKQLPHLERMLAGGSAVPRALIKSYLEEHGVHIWQGWGMTEMSPLGSVVRLSAKMADWQPERRLDVMSTAGFPVPTVEMKLLDDAGQELPWDGKSVGELLVRGPNVARDYYKHPEGSTAFTPDGWFRTGDVASIDEDGFLHISDRTKDLIKSGGEWISSVEMENAIMACPGVVEAAVVARPDAKWDERPVAFVVREQGKANPTPAEIIDFLSDTFAKWQLPAPDDVHFIEQVPRTGVGKFDKKVLRERLNSA